MSRFSFLYLLFIAGFLPAHAQRATVNAVIDATEIPVGEQVGLHATVSCDAGARVRFVTGRRAMLAPGVEIVETSPADTLLLNDGKRWKITRTFTLTSFDSAVYRIPAVEVEVDGKIIRSRGEIALKVNSIDVDFNHPDKMRPAKGPVEGQFGWSIAFFAEILLLWLVIAALVALLALLARPKVRKQLLKIPAPAPPHRQAMEALEALRGTNDGTPESEKNYFMHLTDILRAYIQARFGINAREMTTHEILDRLNGQSDPAVQHELQEILSTADLVKFARHYAGTAESDRALLRSADYVRTTQQPETALPKAEVHIIEVAESSKRNLRPYYWMGVFIMAFTGLCIVAHLCYTLWLLRL